MEDITCRKCGLVNDYKTEMKSGQQTAYCNGCGKYIKNIPYAEPKMYVGKYSQTKISEITDLPYLEWALEKMDSLSVSQDKAVEEQIKKLKG